MVTRMNPMCCTVVCGLLLFVLLVCCCVQPTTAARWRTSNAAQLYQMDNEDDRTPAGQRQQSLSVRQAFSNFQRRRNEWCARWGDTCQRDGRQTALTRCCDGLRCICGALLWQPGRCVCKNASVFGR